jgi:hypothetical protein
MPGRATAVRSGDELVREVVALAGSLDLRVRTQVLDFGAMAALVAIPDQHAAVKAFRDRLRAALPIG